MSESGLGDRLRTAREQKKLTLEQVSEEIRIRPKYLRALEEEKFEELPDFVTAKGFLRNYARFLELDVDEMLRIFKSVAAPSEEPEIHIGTDEELFGRGPIEVRLRDSFGHRSGTVTAIIVILALLALTGWLLVKSGRFAPPDFRNIHLPSIHLKPIAVLKHPTATPTEIPTPTLAPATATPAPPTSTPSPTATFTSTPTATPSPIVLEIDIVGDRSWIQVVADGETKQAGTLPDGTHAKWIAQRKMELVVGNAGYVNVKVDGKEYAPFGKPGEVIHMVWSRQGGTLIEATATPMPPTSTPTVTATITSTVTATPTQ